MAYGKENIMRKEVLSVAGGVCALLLGTLSTQAQEVEPSCNMCESTYVSDEEIGEYLEIDRTDQQIRMLDIGRANVGVALVKRGRLERPAGAAEHSLVSEVYYVLSGSGTNLTGTELIDPEPRVPPSRLNGPGHNASGIRNGVATELKAGDVYVIPAGVGHQFTHIDDHIEYILIRVDPDQIVPLFDEEDSRGYLDEQR